MEEQEKIERYLNGDMSSSEQEVFENEIDQNEMLAEKVAFHQGLTDFFDDFEPDFEGILEGLGEQHFVAETTLPPPTPVFSKKWLWFLSAGILIFFLVWILLPKGETTSTTQQQQNTSEIIEQESVEQTAIPETAPVEAENNTVPQEKTENIVTPPPVRDIIISDEPEDNSNQPIAKLNPTVFKPNSMLESILQEEVRAKGFSTKIKSPILEQEFKSGKTIPLSIEGTTTAKPLYELIIYSNRSRDFNNDYRTLSVEINSTKIEDTYPIKFKANVPLENGLYYWILREKVSEEVLHISKFSVK